MGVTGRGCCWVTGALSLPCDGGGDAAQGRAGRDRQAFGDGRGERVGLLERAEAAGDAHGDEPLRVVAGDGVTAGAHQDQEVEPRLRQFSRASGIPCGAVKSTSRPEPQTSMRETLRIQERGLRPAGTRFGGMVVGGQCTGAGCGGRALSAVLVGLLAPAALRGSRCCCGGGRPSAAWLQLRGGRVATCCTTATGAAGCRSRGAAAALLPPGAPRMVRGWGWGAVRWGPVYVAGWSRSTMASNEPTNATRRHPHRIRTTARPLAAPAGASASSDTS